MAGKRERVSMSKKPNDLFYDCESEEGRALYDAVTYDYDGLQVIESLNIDVYINYFRAAENNGIFFDLSVIIENPVNFKELYSGLYQKMGLPKQDITRGKCGKESDIIDGIYKNINKYIEEYTDVELCFYMPFNQGGDSTLTCVLADDSGRYTVVNSAFLKLIEQETGKCRIMINKHLFPVIFYKEGKLAAMVMPAILPPSYDSVLDKHFKKDYKNDG